MKRVIDTASKIEFESSSSSVSSDGSTGLDEVVLPIAISSDDFFTAQILV